MKKLTSIFILILICSCNIKQSEKKVADKTENANSRVSESKETNLIIGERIDGPANIRHKPNGDILFELKDNALIEVTTKPVNDWYQVLVYADIDYNEYPMDSILKDRLIIVNNDTIGKVIQSHSISSGQGRDFAYAMLYGYTHKNNIKPETVIETAFKNNLTENGRNFSGWKGFIETFKLDKDAVDYDEFESLYNYENSIEDPSPGFRIVLLFDNKNLVGLIHSRELQIENTITHKLNWGYFVTFFDDYPEKGQFKFVNYMNEWIQTVD
ncbi:hypothetical protein [Acidiluteibacter ferrifornacis]|uniref:Uncharacterized protein n=1 Tax=Acidiluteibacter ferrifornacis TaxID=2692424 RepID=A0A6N9NK10_9FLAO|nr:hypothetical protein [Acidiluteibacter ferrifornacis]NBG65507.1 hypothetical protein [Acidiluteibacter ferrifornacis]